MSTPSTTVPVDNSFAALDAEWASLCRRHRRSPVVARWQRTEPDLGRLRALSDVVPPPGVDRTLYFGALVRLTQAGDDVAARALLQLLVPGLVRLAKRLWTRSEPFESTAVDLITTAWVLIERVKAGGLRPRTAGYLLLGIRRYTLLARRRPKWMHGRVPLVDDGEPDYRLHPERAQRGPMEATVLARPNVPLEPSAEDDALAGPLTVAALAGAVESGTVSPIAAQLVWRCTVESEAVPTVATQTGTAVATAYRMRERAHRALREALAEAS